jgi:hypothetical protein
VLDEVDEVDGVEAVVDGVDAAVDGADAAVDGAEPVAEEVTGVGGSDAFWHPARTRTTAERTIDMRLVFMNASTV